MLAYPPFPPLEVCEKVPKNVWDSSIKSWIKALSLSPTDEFVSSYVREQAKSLPNDRTLTPSEAQLRALVFQLVADGTSLKSPSPELVWDFILLYGQTNVKRTCAYVKSIPRSEPLVKKLGKLLLHHAQDSTSSSTGVNDSTVLVASVLAQDSALLLAFVTDDWLAMVDSIGTETTARVSAVIRQGLAAPSSNDTDALINLFPQLSLTRARKVLKSHGLDLEAATNYLLENPSEAVAPEPSAEPESDRHAVLANSSSSASSHRVAGADSAHFGKRDKVVAKDESFNSRNVELVMRMAKEDQEFEDEIDDTYQEAEAQIGETPSAVAAFDAVEQYLWDSLSRDPNQFDRKSRGSKPRQDIKNRTKWSDEQIEGWARILERNPARKRHLEDKYMFRGNRPQHNQSAKNPTRGSSEPSESASSGPMSPSSSSSMAPASESPKQARPPAESSGTNTTSERSTKQKERNKARHGNHNRKAGHAKKMAKMGAS